MKNLRTLFSTLLVFSICTTNAQNGLPAEFDSFVQKIMRENRLPGLAIAVVKDDSVIFAKGYGVRKLGESDSVNEHTLFQAASITKSFTAALMGRLIDEGKIKWNDPVKKHIPELELSEPYVTEKLTVRDLLALRGGILGGDTLKASNRKALIPLIRTLKITNSFRLTQSSFGLMYTLAGHIEERITGKKFEELVKSAFFIPLQMKESHTDIVTALSSTKNVSTPHLADSVTVTPTTWEHFDLYSPADCIITNVMDLSQWVRFILREGSFNTKSIVSRETMAEMQRPQIIMADSWKEYFNPTAQFMTTGLGFLISDYRGYRMVEMDGAATGTSNTMTMIPSAKIGVVIQTNMDWAFSSLVRIKFRVFDYFLSKE